MSKQDEFCCGCKKNTRIIGQLVFTNYEGDPFICTDCAIRGMLKALGVDSSFLKEKESFKRKLKEQEEDS